MRQMRNITKRISYQFFLDPFLPVRSVRRFGLVWFWFGLQLQSSLQLQLQLSHDLFIFTKNTVLKISYLITGQMKK